VKHWGSAIFPLSLMLALAGLTSWLRYATDMPEERHDGKTRHDPDYIVSKSVLRKLDPQGQLKYTLYSDEVRHFPDDDSTDLLKPRVVYLSPKKAPFNVTSERGHVSSKGDRVDLDGDVRLFRPASGRDPELTASMPDLTVFPDDERAFTKSPALLTRGPSWVKGVGLQVDHKAETYVFESQVVGQSESKHARKTKP
jgi:lipopolysaccharide export system protein LptC